jgi:type VI secretion system protein ImpL
LREFQRAAQIRDAFFSTGGNMPSITLGVTPPALAAADATIKMDVNGVIVESKQGSSSPVAVQWPGAGGGRTAISVEQTIFGAPTGFGQPGQQAGGGTPSVLQRTGVWSLFRLLDAAAPALRGDRVVASFIVGGRDLQYQFGASTAQNPLMLPALREFRCPNGI